MPKSRYHHGDLRQALLDAARRLVAERGPDGFTMAQAAREAGVSSGAPYRHFADRGELMRALAREGQASLEARIAAATSGISDPREAFRQTGIAFARFAVEERGWYRVMQMPEYTGFHQDHPDVVAFWAPFAELVKSVPPGEPLPAGHPLIAQFAARALVQGLATFLVQDSLRPLGIEADRVEQLADGITRFLALPDAPPDA